MWRRGALRGTGGGGGGHRMRDYLTLVVNKSTGQPYDRVRIGGRKCVCVCGGGVMYGDRGVL